MQDLQDWAEAVTRNWAAWAERVIQDMQPLITALAKAFPKQPVVNRRKLAARRARRRSERRYKA